LARRLHRRRADRSSAGLVHPLICVIRT